MLLLVACRVCNFLLTSAESLGKATYNDEQAKQNILWQMITMYMYITCIWSHSVPPSKITLYDIMCFDQVK